MSRRSQAIIRSKKRNASLTSSLTSSTASLSPSCHPLVQNNQFTPDLTQLANEIGANLLEASPDSALCDITIQSSDNINLPANKTLLAIRSNYFKNMFFSPFLEAEAPHIEVPIRAEQLRYIFQFIYTADCSLVHDALKSLPPSGNASLQQIQKQVISRALFHKVVDLAAAADYCQISQLQRLANETLSAMITVCPRITCTALEAMRRHPMALKFCDPLRLWSNIMIKPRQYFLVPDCAAVPRDTKSDNGNLVSDDASVDRTSVGDGAWSNYGVLELSADTLDYLLRFSTASSDHEYLFQVIYWWATNGCGVRPAPSEHGNSHLDHHESIHEIIGAESKERWIRGQQLTIHINWHKVRPEFIRDIVESTGLVAHEVLFEAYKFHAIKTSPDGKRGRPTQSHF